MNDIEKKRQRIELGVKIVSLLVVGFLVAPFVFVAIKGLVGLLVAGAISLTAIQFAPYFAAKIANWRIKLIRAEAAANPIESLLNSYNIRQMALNQFLESIKSFSSEVKTFESKLEKFAKEYPAEVPKFKNQLSQMKQLLIVRTEKYQQAKENLASYDLEIQKASALFDMAKAAAAMSKAAGVNNEEFLEKIQRETALDSVEKSLNVAFADLEIALMEEKDVKSLPSTQQNNVIEIEAPKFAKTN